MASFKRILGYLGHTTKAAATRAKKALKPVLYTGLYAGILGIGVATCEQTLGTAQKKVGEKMIERENKWNDPTPLPSPAFTASPTSSFSSWFQQHFNNFADSHLGTETLETRLAWYKPPILEANIYDRHGTLISTIHHYVGVGKASAILDIKQLPLAAFSPNLSSAAVAIEDQRFDEHYAIDVFSTSKALLCMSAKRADEYAGIHIPCELRGTSTLAIQDADRLLPPLPWEKGYGRKLTPGEEIERKKKEIMLATQLEQTIGKKGVLALYHNLAYFSSDRQTREHVIGMEAGARHFFGKSSGQVTPLESAILVAGVNKPTYIMLARDHFLRDERISEDSWLNKCSRDDLNALFPHKVNEEGRVTNKDHALAWLGCRTKSVLDAWYAKSRAGGFQHEPYHQLSEEEYALAMRELRGQRLPFQWPEQSEHSGKRADANEFVRHLDEQVMALPFLRDPGVHDIEIHSTLDLGLQQHARGVFKEYLEKVREKTKKMPEHMSGAIVVLDTHPERMQNVLAVIGNEGSGITRKGESLTWFDRSLQPADAGSVSKLFAYAIGIEHGFISLSDTYFDAPTEFLFKNADPKGRPIPWNKRKKMAPGNFQGKYAYADLTFFDALVKSTNVGAATVIQRIIERTGGLSSERDDSSKPPRPVGSKYMRDYLNQLGLGLTRYSPADVLKTEAAPLAVAGALSVFENGGQSYRYEPRGGSTLLGTNYQLFSSITYKTANGETVSYVPVAHSPHTPVFKESTLASLDEALRKVVSEGTAKNAKMKGYVLRGKTGTHDHGVSGFLYSPEKRWLIYLVYRSDKPDLTGTLPGSSVNGGLIAMPAGRKIMEYGAR